MQGAVRETAHGHALEYRFDRIDHTAQAGRRKIMPRAWRRRLSERGTTCASPTGAAARPSRRNKPTALVPSFAVQPSAPMSSSKSWTPGPGLHQCRAPVTSPRASKPLALRSSMLGCAIFLAAILPTSPSDRPVAGLRVMSTPVRGSAGTGCAPAAAALTSPPPGPAAHHKGQLLGAARRSCGHLPVHVGPCAGFPGIQSAGGGEASGGAAGKEGAS